MSRTLSAIGLALAVASGLAFFPSAAQAQKGLVYCPAPIDATGCGPIITALSANPSPFPDGVETAYDGSSGTVDLATADLSAYAVLVVPSLADGAGAEPYGLLRNQQIVGRLSSAFNGRNAVWSGTPDHGSTNRAAKDALLRNLAGWARADAGAGRGAGIVVLQDNSDDGASRYGWLRGISGLTVVADTTFEVYSNVQVLTSTGSQLLTNSSGLQIGYSNMAAYGLTASGSGVGNDATGGRTTRVVLVTMAGEVVGVATGIATVVTDKEDYQPGDTVVVTGAGWAPGETVDLLFHEDVDPPIHPDKSYHAVADDAGHIFNRDYEIELTDVGIRFTLQATGQTSGRTAQTTFTDGQVKVKGAASGITFIVNWSHFNTNNCTGTADLSGSATVNGTTAENTRSTNNGESIRLTAVTPTGGATAGFVFSAWSVSGATFTPDPPGPTTSTANPVCVVGNNGSPDVTATYIPGTSLTVSAASGTYGGTASLSATLRRTSDNALLSGKLVSFTLNGTAVGSATTNVSGVATLAGASLAGINAGTYPTGVGASFAGETGATPLGASSGTASLTVANASTSIAITSDLPDPSDPAEAITVTYTVSVTAPGAGTPTGSVTVSDGVNSCIGTVAAGSCSVSLTTSGARTLTATYAGDGNFFGSTSPGVAHQVRIGTTTALARTTGSNPSIYGDPLTFTATVTRTVGGSAVTTGNVTFKAGGTSCSDATTLTGSTNPATLNGSGEATFSISALTVPGSPHTIRACYADAGGTFASSNASVSHTVNKKALTITAENKTRVFGAPNPTFTVLYAGFVLSETESVLGGTLNCITTATGSSPVGTYPITCSGQTADNYSLAYSPGQLTITPAPTATAADDATGTYGDASVTLTAHVTANSPSTATVSEGSVDFTVNGTTVSGNVSGGTATATFALGAGVNAGTYSIAASYQPAASNPNFLASTATPATLTVEPAPTTTTLARTTGVSPSTYGDPLTFTATVHYTASSATPSATSTVTFKDGATALGSPVAIGACNTTTKECTAAFSVANLNVPGSPHSITAHYDGNGDGNFAASTSGAVSQTVNKAELTITAEDKTRIFGAPDPTFTVLYAGFVLSETESVLGGTLNCTTTATGTSPVGTYSTTCSGQTADNYSLNYVPGMLTITPAPTTTAAEDATGTYGDASVTLTAHVTANSPSTATVSEGSVDFTVNGTTVSGNVSGGTATATFALGAGVNAGTYSIAASYQPAASNPNFLASTDATPGTLTVEPAPTSTVVVLKTGTNPSTYGDPLTFEATVTYTAASGSPDPASTVTFMDGATTLGSAVALSSNCNTTTKECTAELSIATLAVNGGVAHSITAHYDGNGNGNFAASTSDPVSHTVNKKALTITAENKTRVFGAPDPTFTVIYAGFVLRETESVLGGTLNCTTTAIGSSPVGTYPITCSGQTADNYSLTYAPGVLTIEPAPTSTAVDNATAVYGDASVSLTAAVSANSPSTATVNEGSVDFTVNGTTVSGNVIAGSATATLTLGAGVNAGSYSIAASYQPAASNPNFLASTDATPGTLTVAPAPTTTTLARTAGADPSIYGDPLTFTATVHYTAPSGAPDPASTVTFMDGVTTLGSAVALSSNCNTTTKECTAELSIATLTVNGGVPHSITAHYDGNGNGNFGASTSGAVNQTVNKKALTITAENKTREYGLANPPFTVAYSGFVLSQTESVLGGSLNCTTPATPASSVAGSPYTITCSGQTAANYELNYQPGSLAVTPAPLTVTANNKTKVYGNGVPVFDGMIVGIRNGDAITASYVAGSGGAITATTAVGTYPIKPMVSFPPGIEGNYALVKNDGTLSIIRADPVYENLSGPTIVFGTASTTLTGKLSYNGVPSGGLVVYPSGSVMITVNGTTVPAAINASTGVFSVSFPTGSLPVNGPGYSILYAYPSDANFNAANDNSKLLKVLYNTTVGHQFLQPVNIPPQQRSAFKIGSTIPVKFELYSADGVTKVTNAVATIELRKISDNMPASVAEEVYTNVPDQGSNFRYTGGQYIFNLGTKKVQHTAGLYQLTAFLNDGTRIVQEIEMKAN